MSSIQEFLDFAVDAAWQAGQLTLAHFQTGITVDWKEDQSPVTMADRASETLLRELIGKRFPGHAVVGEEMGGDRSPGKDGDHRWIIDPIDGTQSFISGVPLYGVLLGLEISGKMIVGVAYFPGLGEMVAAGRGLGCHLNGRRARVSRVSRLEEALVAFTDVSDIEERSSELWARLKQATRLQRGWSDCYGHCLVATGRAEIMLDPIMKVWDCAALLPILQEAGGTFTDWDGNVTVYGESAISTNGALLEPLMDLIKSAS
jgi:histidinol phosphatase-like enzyme (inositol monophosphatase family)